MENKKELGIYIHIPFCKQKCYYCDFVSYAINNLVSNENNCLSKKYINSLKKELKSYNLENYNITTIYIGGGTPSIICANYIQEILVEIKQKINTSNPTKWEDIEITIEVNPGTVDLDKLKTYKKSGINRLSIGLQSTDNEMLKQIGRIHTFEEFLNTYNNAKKVGFENINVDLMIGLPNQTIANVKQSLNEIIKLNPTHISVYSLIVEEGTPISKMIENGKLQTLEDEQERAMYWYVKNTLELNGYSHYEISNFSQKGKESKHNMNCWEQKEYIGLGVAAYSYLNDIRYGNVDNLQEYIGGAKKIIDEKQDEEAKRKEYMLLGLRKIEGVSIQKFKEKYVENPIFLFRKELEKLVEEKLLIIDGDRIRLTNKGLDLANQVWMEFI